MLNKEFTPLYPILRQIKKRNTYLNIQYILKKTIRVEGGVVHGFLLQIY